MGKLINRIPGSRLLIPSLPGSALRTHVESLGKPREESTSVLKALPGKLDIKRHSNRFLYLSYDVASGSEITSFIRSINHQWFTVFGKRYEMTPLTSRIWQNPNVFTQNNFNVIKRILHWCSCIIEFIKLVAKKLNARQASHLICLSQLV